MLATPAASPSKLGRIFNAIEYAMVGILWTQRGFISELKPSKKKANSTSPTDGVENEKQAEHEPDIRSDKIRYPLNLQSRLFLAGVISFIAFGVVKVFNNKSEPLTMSVPQQPANSGKVKCTSDSLILK